MGELLIQAGRLVNGTTQAAQEHVDILVSGDAIAAIGPRGSLTVPAGTQVLDYAQRTVMPGLIDLHIHFGPTITENEFSRTLESGDLRLIRSVRDARNLLHAGFTTARHVGGPDGIPIRDAVLEGEIEGPTLQAAGLPISQTSGHADIHYMPVEWVQSGQVRSGILADGPDACRQAVRRNFREGVDLIKIMAAGGVATQKDHPQHAQFCMEEIRTIVEEAARWGRRVAAHCGGAGTRQAVLGGVTTIEHGYFMDQETADLMAEKQVYYVPTLLRQYVGVYTGPKVGSSQWLNDKFKQVWEGALKGVAMAHKAGCKIGLGTDLGLRPFTRHGGNWQEAELLVEAGLSNLEAIRAGTAVAAEAMGLEQAIGTVAVGRKADLIAVEGDPLTDIKALSRVKLVVKRGEVVRSEG